MEIIKTLFVVLYYRRWGGIGPRLIFLFSLAIFLSSVCHAEIVMYRDANGVLCFSNTAPADNSEVEKTYKETKEEVSSPKEYESVKKQEPRQIDVEIKGNDAESQRQKAKETHAPFEQKIAFEKRRLNEKLKYYKTDCLRRNTPRSRSTKLKQAKKAQIDFCRSKYLQTAESIKLLEKDPEYYFYNKRENK